MPRGRQVPPQPAPTITPRELEHLERRAALLTLDPTLIRAWASKWRVPLLPTDDDGLLEQAHGAILRDDGLPAEARVASAAWLAERGDELAQAVIAALRQRGASTDILATLGIPAPADNQPVT